MSRIGAVYKLRYQEEFEWLLPVHERDFDLLRFNGQPRAASWVSPEMKRLTVSDRGMHLKAGDFFACSGGDMLIFGDRVKQAIGPELERCGEVLPLSCDGRTFWTLNVTRLADMLDEAASQVVRASDTGGILMIRRHVFKATTEAEDGGLFKLSQTPRGLIYATESFADLLKEHHLVGLELVQVWAPS